MADQKRVLLHIGAPKTGTTYLQQVMHANRDALAENGVLYPRIRGDAHHSAVWDLRGKFEGDGPQQRFSGHWDRLVEAVAAWEGRTVVVSSEHFVFSGRAQVKRIREALGSGDLHLVYTARDLARQVPAVWQEQIKNRRTMRYTAYLDDVLGKRSTKLAQHFWQAQDAVAALERWSAGMPADHVHVVTAPPPGAPPETLWQRYASVLGIDPDAYDVDIPLTNESLGVAAVELLRRYNERHGKMDIIAYRRKVLRPLQAAMEGGVNDRSKLPLTDGHRARIDRLSEQLVVGLRDAGYAVTGHLEDLVPTTAAAPGTHPGPDDLTDADVVASLVDLLHDLLGAPAGAVEADVDEETLDEGGRSSPLQKLRRLKG